jgi:hypothetical protein
MQKVGYHDALSNKRMQSDRSTRYAPGLAADAER